MKYEYYEMPIDNPIFVDITKKAFQSAKPWETNYLENNGNV